MAEPESIFNVVGRPSLGGSGVRGSEFGKFAIFTRGVVSSTFPDTLKIKMSAEISTRGRKLTYQTEDIVITGSLVGVAGTQFFYYKPFSVPLYGPADPANIAVDSTSAPLVLEYGGGKQMVIGYAYVDRRYNIFFAISADQLSPALPAKILPFALTFEECELYPS